MQNLARFCTTFDFYREYLHDAFGETSPVSYAPLCRKFDVWVWPTQIDFFGRLYFGP